MIDSVYTTCKGADQWVVRVKRGGRKKDDSEALWPVASGVTGVDADAVGRHREGVERGKEEFE